MTNREILLADDLLRHIREALSEDRVEDVILQCHQSGVTEYTFVVKQLDDLRHSR